MMKCIFCNREGQPGKLALFRIKGKGSVYDGGHVCDECLLQALESRDKELQQEHIERNRLHGGECVTCERLTPTLNAGGECEACELDAIIQMRAL